MQLDWDTLGIVRQFLGPAAVAAAVSWAFQLFAKGKLDAHFATRLEDFKARRQADLKTYEAELSRIGDAAKFNYSRRLADFTLFSAKRHDVYPELYRGYRVAFDAYREYARRFHHDPAYRHLDEAEMVALMTRKRVPATERGEVVAQWNANRDAGVNLLHKALDRPYRRRARALLDKAQGFWLANYVYMSRDVKVIVPPFVKSLADYARLVERSSADPTESEALIPPLRTQIEELSEVLRDELAQGDYEKSDRPSATDAGSR